MTSKANADELDQHVKTVVMELYRRASRGVFDGTPRTIPYVNLCTVNSEQTGTRILFTRDVGYHSSGWWKNPDYERCFHLSLSAIRRIVLARPELAELDRKTTAQWVRAFFGPDVSKLWVESPYSPEGKASGVVHWRLFCDEGWKPILPRGEVYSTQFTELGWKSASEVLADGEEGSAEA